MKFDIDFNTKKSSIQIKGEEVDIDLSKLLNNITDGAPFDTGILPVEGDGLLSYRKGFGREQIVWQFAPTKRTIVWGQRESEQNKPKYWLAQPFVIIIGDFQDGNFLGLRHFYSPEAIYSHKQALYAINLPNTNTTTYGGTSVGWACIYPHQDGNGLETLSQKIGYVLMRENGAGEPYNNANMSSTDGPRFYQGRKAPKKIWDPDAWEQETAKHEDLDWVLDKDLWQPLKIDWNSTPSAEGFSDNGEIYTLGDAIYKPYYPYYPHRFAQPFVLPMNALYWAEQDAKVELENVEDENERNKIIQKAFSQRWKDDEDLLDTLSNFWRIGQPGKGSGQANKATPAEKTVSQIVEELRNSKGLTNDQLKTKFLSDGILCVRCEKKYPDEDHFYNVITSYEMNDYDLDSIKFPDGATVRWCLDCTNAFASNIAGVGLVSYAAGVFSYAEEKFYLPEMTAKCETCDNVVLAQNMLRHFVFDGRNLTQDSKDVIKELYTTGRTDSYATLAKQVSYCSICQETIMLDNAVVLQFNMPKSDDITLVYFNTDPNDLDKYAVGSETVEEELFYTVNQLKAGKPDENGIDFKVLKNYIPKVLFDLFDLKICPCNQVSTSTDICKPMCINEQGEYSPPKALALKEKVND